MVIILTFSPLANSLSDTSGSLGYYLAICDLITNQNWKQLLQYDELNRELSAGRVLEGFTALQPSFPPTFKRVRGSSLAFTYEPIEDDAPNSLAKSRILTATSPSPTAVVSSDPINPLVDYYSRKRLPSYTDRILHKSLPGFRDHLTMVIDSIQLYSVL